MEGGAELIRLSQQVPRNRYRIGVMYSISASRGEVVNKNIVVVLGVIFLVGAWFLVSPLFIDETVDESFDFVTDDGQIDMQAVMAMSPDKRLAMMPDIMEAAAGAPDRVASNVMPTDTPQVVPRVNSLLPTPCTRAAGRPPSIRSAMVNT